MSSAPIDLTQPCLIADVGGTNARFAVAHPSATQGFVMGEASSLPCADFNHFEDLLAHHLGTIADVKPKQAILAVAGPVKGDEFSMTNLGWTFSLSRLKDAFQWHNILLINDFVAQAYAALALAPEQRFQLATALSHDATLPKVVLGPGTGLGIAGLIHESGRWTALPSEAGHMRAAAISDEMAQVIDFLRREQCVSQSGYVSYENLLSGPGLENIYRGLRQVYGWSSEGVLNAVDISRLAALDDSSSESRLARQSVDCFSKTLASFAGDAALMMCARGGVYIGGGIFPRWISRLNREAFMTLFQDKGGMSSFLSGVPITVMTGEYLALQGLCEWLKQQKLGGEPTSQAM